MLIVLGATHGLEEISKGQRIKLALRLEPITDFTYNHLGAGYCSDYAYLPEGGYPARLSPGKALYDADPIKECLNRCLNASTFDATNVGNQAFYLKSGSKCACAADDCSSLKPKFPKRESSGYDSYEIIPDCSSGQICPDGTYCVDGTCTVAKYDQKKEKYCMNRGDYGDTTYQTLEIAKNACDIQDDCIAIMDQDCDDLHFQLCTGKGNTKSTIEPSTGLQPSCVYVKFQE